MSVEDLWDDVAPVTPTEFGVWGEAISKAVDALPDGITTLPLTAVSPFKVGTASITDEAGTLVVPGPLASDRDLVVVHASDMLSNGTLIDKVTTDTGMPRWSLANASTQRTKWSFPVPAGWHTVGVHFAWAKEAAGSGNVKWQFRYMLVSPLSNPNIEAGAMTLLDVPAIAVHATQYGFKLDAPALMASIATPEGAFGVAPHLLCSLSRIGADAADTYAGAVSVISAHMVRVD